MKKLIINLLRWSVPVAIIAWLAFDSVRNERFQQVWHGPKRWDLLALATVICFVATMCTIVRWHFLVRAVDIPVRLRDSFRLGFLGYLLNFISPGSVGGDLFKAVFLAREQRDRKAEVAVTVVVDRLNGLYGLFLLCTTAILWTGLWHSESAGVRFACKVIFWSMGISTAIVAVSCLPGFSKGPISRWLESLSRVGPLVQRLNRATRMYYRHFWVLPLATLITIVAQSMFAIGIWLVARGLLSDAPTLAEHFVIVPMGMVTGALPLAPNGLGTFEALIDYMYRQLPGGAAVAGAGFLVALGYRLITVFIAMVGAGVYLASRREMSQVLHEAEEQVEAESHAHDEAQGAHARRPAMSL